MIKLEPLKTTTSTNHLTKEPIIMDTNTITLTLIGKQVIATLNVNGQIFGQAYPTREKALDVFFTEAANLAERGILANNSGIIN